MSDEKKMNTKSAKVKNGLPTYVVLQMVDSTGQPIKFDKSNVKIALVSTRTGEVLKTMDTLDNAQYITV